MRVGIRLVACLAGASCLTMLTAWRFLLDLGSQYSALAYLQASMSFALWEDMAPAQPLTVKPGDQIIVMAKMESEDASWVEEELPHWQRAIYVVDPTTRRPDILATPVNKGHEAMAYLTYIIENYHRLPSTIAFLHSHRRGFFEAWHVDTPMHDNVAAMRALQLGYVQANGYVNLRCNWNPGCLENHRVNRHITHDVWHQLFGDTSTPSPNKTVPGSPADVSYAEERDKELIMPMEIGAACCAQFAVSRDQVLKRPIADYVKFRRWVVDTEQDDAHSGRVMEFLWHVIFGKEAVYCPLETACYCHVYDRC